MADAFARPAPPAARVALSVENAGAERVGPVSFAVAAGETLGLVGLRGAGHHTIGRAIFGQTPLSSGRMQLDGATFAPENPAEAMAAGVGFISSRRAEEGIAANLSVRENIYMNPVVTGRDVFEFVSRGSETRNTLRRDEALLDQGRGTR